MYQAIQLPYAADSTDLMQRIGSLDLPVLLDSGAQSRPAGRFDILSACPSVTIEATDKGILCSAPLPDNILRGGIFPAARHVLAEHARSLGAPDRAATPFAGGLMGYLGYPKLGSRGTCTLTSARLGLYLWSIVVDHASRNTTLHFLSTCPQETRGRILEVLHGAVLPSTSYRLPGGFANDLSRARYDASFQRIQAYIQAGDCYQVNLAQRFSGRFEGSSLGMYLALRNAAAKPLSAYMGWPDGALLCLSPERFLSVEDSIVKTEPIKGTRPRGSDPQDDRHQLAALVGSEKDRAENLMIVDLLRNDLGRACEPGSIRALSLFEPRTYSNVHHLVSTLQGRLRKSCSALDLMEICFPGGSVTGAPKIRAMEIIEELEQDPRLAYCGTVLYMGFNGRMDSNITIRTVYCEGQNAYCWAGGGIVADSDCESEYQECFAKIGQLIDLLARCQPG